jgi:alcohol dehydrogenase class IV
VTDGAAYKLCGAEAFVGDVFSELATGDSHLATIHLVVPGANPRVEVVQGLLDKMEGDADAFVAVGGGTTIDTAKLLNLALVSGLPIRELLMRKTAPERLRPCLAMPTTAGTGAEATRFAVCYDGEVKHSIDFEAIRPSDVAIVPEFTATLPPYQKASTNFDAYAQAVESLWAVGATDESRTYARKALKFIEAENWTEASYWAGRAIDISRTTAAHALSYYMTSHYGIPHGHAVYMMFPYVCRANGHPEFIRVVPELKTLRDFASDEGIAWDALIDTLLANVNLKRLGNNPCPISRETFGI